MNKKKYKIQCSGYGGRCSIVEKDKDFIEEWTRRLDDGETAEDLASELIDDIDFLDSDLECIYGGYADTYFNVYEIQGDDEIEIHEHIHFTPFISREIYMREVDEDITEGSSPIVTYHASEKGTFGDWYIELDGDIEVGKIALSTVETYVGEFVEGLYYDGKLLEIDLEWADSFPKHEEAYIGWLDLKSYEKVDIFDCRKRINEMWGYYEESL